MQFKPNIKYKTIIIKLNGSKEMTELEKKDSTINMMNYVKQLQD